MTQDRTLTAEQRTLIAQSTVRLKEEYRDTFSADTVERFVLESQVALETVVRINTWLPVLIERFARDRLRALALADGLVESTKPTVLFLCVHNAGRSQMAAGWLRHLAGDAVEVFTGGSDPGSEVNPAAVTAMAEVGVDISEEFPRPWTDEVVRAADVVVTMGCGDACPIVPGTRYEDWELTDPAGQAIEVVRGVRDDIERRVRELFATLVPASAD